MPTLEKRRKNVLTADKQRRLVAGVEHKRDKLIIRLMLETGAREEGIANVRTSDLIERDRRYYFVRITDKTGSREQPQEQDHKGIRANADGRDLQDDQSSCRGCGIRPPARPSAPAPGPSITRVCNSGMHPAMVREITGVSVAVIALHYHHPAPEDVWEAAMKALGS